MTELSRLWVGMLTRNDGNAGTNSEIALIINQDGIDRVHHTFFFNTSQWDLERGQANLYTASIEGNGVDTSKLTDSSIRIEIIGDDLWRPEHIFIWGEGSRSPFTIIPVAISTDITTALSGDSSEGVSSIPINLVEFGPNTMEINRLLLLMTTDGWTSGGWFGGEVFQLEPAHQTDVAGAGTDSPIELKIESGGSLVVHFTFPGTPQKDQEEGQANLYFAPVSTSFKRSSLTVTSINLEIKGSDAWLPSSFFLFGFDGAAGRSERVIPLVHLPVWPFGFLSTDSSEGIPNITLPLAEAGIRIAASPMFAQEVTVTIMPTQTIKQVSGTAMGRQTLKRRPLMRSRKPRG